mgnify:CR=1 FL=1|jgi:hypothetical protein
MTTFLTSVAGTFIGLVLFVGIIWLVLEMKGRE